MNMQDAEARICELETKLAFAEDSIDRMGREMAEQQKDIDKLTLAVRNLATRLKAAAQGSNVAPMSEETPPPHY